MYAKDAMTGLRLMNQIMDPATRPTVLQREPPPPEQVPQTQVATSEQRSSRVRPDIPLRPRPAWTASCATFRSSKKSGSMSTRNAVRKAPGYRGNFEKRLAERDQKTLELFHQVEEVKRWAEGFMKVRAVWQFFEAERKGIQSASRDHTFHFGRQPRRTDSA